MSRWFRFHSDAIRNPKIARLSDKQYRLWTELMAVAAENDGHIPPLNDLRYVLNRRLDHLSTGVDQLISGGLIDQLADGYEPHNWSKHQYKSDSSKERVAKHRAGGNVTVTPPETDTDTETVRTPPNGGGKTEILPRPPAEPESDDLVTQAEVIEGWNTIAARHGLARIAKLTEARKRKLALQRKRFTVPEWVSVWAKIEQSPFLRGSNDRGWRCDFDFVLSEANFTKILEGKYDEQQTDKRRLRLA